MSENQYKTALDNETIAIESVTKRDGTLAPFDSNRIYNAILKAGTSTNEFGEQEAWLLTGQVLKVLKHKFAESLPSIEQIQDIVEQVLISANYFATAKAYILYRDQRNRSRADKKVMVDVESSINEYLEKLDWRVNANANQGYSNGGLILNVAGKVTANYWLSHVYPAEVGEAHRNGDIHIHDLDMLAAYCAGWSLKNLLHEGFNGVPGKAEAGPAKHLSAAVGQMVNFMGTLQNEWAGAQAFSSVDTYLAPYIRADNLSYEQVEQAFQELIYNLNVPSRWGSQTPFTNFTFDWVCPEDLRDKHPLIAGVEQPFTYGDLKPEMDMINKAYINVMMKGDIKGRPFTFPIPTYNMTPDFPWEDENTELLFEMTAKYGTPYFSNYINSDMEPNDVRSMCCRLRLDLRELRKKSGGFFGSGESTGSVGVVTINLPRIAYLAEGEADFYRRLDKLMDIAARSLKTKRMVITKLMEGGLYPYTRRYLGTFENHFSTIGLVGMNEAGLNAKWLRKDLTHPETQAFAKDVLNHMRQRLSDYQEQYGDLYNLEATPAESTAYRLAKHDKMLYPDIITANENGTPYYTNSSHLPVGYTEDIFSALDVQDELQTLYTSGTVFHAFLGEKLPDWKAAASLVRKIAENYRLPYYTLSPTYSVCKNHGYLAGEQPVCPFCGEKAEVYSRITGYYRPVQNWNDGKAQEFKDRRTYDIGASKLTHCGVKEQAQTPEPPAEQPCEAVELFATKTCPNCKQAEQLLDAADIRYTVRFAEENRDTVRALGIRQAPTLVSGGQKWTGVSGVREFIAAKENANV